MLDDYAFKCKNLVNSHEAEECEAPLEQYMRENLEDEDVLSLMTQVNHHVAVEFTSKNKNNPDFDKKKCMPWIAHQLRKLVYLHKIYLQQNVTA